MVETIIDKLRIIEEIVKLPSYSIAGVTESKLVYMSTREGIRNLWALNLKTNESIKLTEKGVSGVADIKSKSPRVIYTRDVSGGKELHKGYSV